MASLLHPVISLITTNARLAGDFLGWMEPYAVLGRVFPSGETLLNDVDGAQTQLLVLASAASDLPLGTLLRMSQGLESFYNMGDFGPSFQNLKPTE